MSLSGTETRVLRISAYSIEGPNHNLCLVFSLNKLFFNILYSKLTQNLTGFTIWFNSLPKDKILDWSNLKAFADDKINVTKKLKCVLGREENIVGKGEHTGNQHFLLFLQCFQKLSFPEVLKIGIVWERS